MTAPPEPQPVLNPLTRAAIFLVVAVGDEDDPRRYRRAPARVKTAGAFLADRVGAETDGTPFVSTMNSM